MDRGEFDTIVRLAEKAYKATLEAKAAHKEYADAATQAYARQAVLQAKKAYEDCINAPDFKQALIERMNRDFKTSFSADDSAPQGSASAESEKSDSDASLESDLGAASRFDEKPASGREFAIDYEPAESSHNVWQNRT